MSTDVPAGVGASPLYTRLWICIFDYEEGVQMCASPCSSTPEFVQTCTSAWLCPTLVTFTWTCGLNYKVAPQNDRSGKILGENVSNLAQPFYLIFKVRPHAHEKVGSGQKDWELLLWWKVEYLDFHEKKLQLLYCKKKKKADPKPPEAICGWSGPAWCRWWRCQ